MIDGLVSLLRVALMEPSWWCGNWGRIEAR